MCPHKMHFDEVETDAMLVRRLLSAQFPQWADLPIEPVQSVGTDNALYRLGLDMVVRLPRTPGAVGSVDKDLRWMPKLAPLLPVSVPVPLAKGTPAESYPWEWGIYTWLEGENPSVDGVTGVDSLTRDLGRFVDAMQRIDLPGGPPSHRGVPLTAQDEEARSALEELGSMIDTDAATAVWDEALKVPAWSGQPAWIHGDLLPGNLLLHAGRLTGVIDWSALGVGDPACDMIVAWGLLPPSARDSFRAALSVDDATWARGRGWALSIGLIALPYYKETNPGLAATAQHLICQVLADHKGHE